METFECVACCGTYTGDRWQDAYNLGWRKHEYGKASMYAKPEGSVTTCGDCEARFAERRKVKAQFNAIVKDAGLAA